MADKDALRRTMRARRREHVEALPETVRALILSRPPAPLLEMIPGDAAIGLYHPHRFEAPTLAYARFFHERGHPLALPWFARRDAAMEFRLWTDPYDADELTDGPFGVPQPRAVAQVVEPGVVFVPLIAFTARGERLGQGGGHYDRWLAEHPDAIRIGLAWDCQLMERLPIEGHDARLRAVVTPTRLFEGQHDA